MVKQPEILKHKSYFLTFHFWCIKTLFKKKIRTILAIYDNIFYLSYKA